MPLFGYARPDWTDLIIDIKRLAQSKYRIIYNGMAVLMTSPDLWSIFNASSRAEK